MHCCHTHLDHDAFVFYDCCLSSPSLVPSAMPAPLINFILNVNVVEIGSKTSKFQVQVGAQASPHSISSASLIALG